MPRDGTFRELKFTFIRTGKNKYAAFCTICKKILINTATCRLQLHRKTCKISSDTASVSSSEPSNQTEDQLGTNNQAEENSSDSEEVEMGVTKKEDGVRRLQCDYHLQNIGNLFKNLYLSDTLTDVTVACKDGSMNAHKIVLSAYSSYFNELIANSRTTNTHLTFVMHKISITNMKYLLEFMYKGFIDIPEECVADLMLIASELEVKGFLLSNEISLAHNSESGRYDDGEEIPKSHNNSTSSVSDENDGRRNTRYKGQKRVPVCEKIEHDVNLTPSKINRRKSNAKVDSASHFVIKEISGSNGQILPEKSKPNAASSPFFSMTMSPSSSKNQTMSDEIEIENGDNPIDLASESSAEEISRLYEEDQQNDEEFKYPCESCSLSFRRLSSLTKHRHASHREDLPYQCQTCHKRFAKVDKFRNHMRDQHDEEDYKPKPHEQRKLNIINPEYNPRSRSSIGRSNDEFTNFDPNDPATATQSIIQSVREVTVNDAKRLSDSQSLDSSLPVKRKRGRPRTREIRPKLHSRRGRPKKSEQASMSMDNMYHHSQENYDYASLPYGDFSYLASELASQYQPEPPMIYPEPVLGALSNDSPPIPDVLSITKIAPPIDKPEKVIVKTEQSDFNQPSSQELPTDLTISCISSASEKIKETSVPPLTINPILIESANKIGTTITPVIQNTTISDSKRILCRCTKRKLNFQRKLSINLNVRRQHFRKFYNE